jgi:hypothetical protein
LRRPSSHRRASRLLALALAPLLAAALTAAAETPSAPRTAPPTSVRAGESLLVPIDGAIYAEPLDPSIATATTPRPGIVSITGIREGATLITVVTPDAIVSLPVSVLPAPRPPAPSASAASPGGSLTFRFIPTATLWDAEIDTPSLSAAFSPGAWWAVYSAPGLAARAASALPTPLTDLGAPLAPGLRVSAGRQWDVLLTTRAQAVSASFATSAGPVTLGLSTLGPYATASLSLATLSLSIEALAATPAVTSTATASLPLGPVTLGYRSGPQGGSPFLHGTTGSVVYDIGIASGGAWSAALSLPAGTGTLTLSAGSAGAWTLTILLPLGPSMAVSAFLSSMGGAAQYTESPMGQPPSTAGSQTLLVQLQQDPLPSGSPLPPILRASWPFTIHGALAAASWSVTPLPTPSQAQAINRAAETLLAPQAPSLPGVIALRAPLGSPPPSPGETHSASPSPGSPTGLIIVRVCETAAPAPQCSSTDLIIPATVLVDGHPEDTTYPTAVAPGPHIVELPPDSVPPLMSPLTPLRCSVTVTAASAARCDFPLRPVTPQRSPGP